MSVASYQSTASSVAAGKRNEIFQDLPILDKSTRLTVMELKYCDKQIVNELVYRWCRILTRLPKKQLELPSMSTMNNPAQDVKKVLIIDLIGAFSAIRLGTILKRDEKRLRTISIARGCKINSTFVTISSYLGRQANTPSSLKLVVIYHDEFFILKTLDIIKDCIQTTKCQIVLIIPKLDRRDEEVLNITSTNQILRCDFCINRKELGRTQYRSSDESQLNQVYFQRSNHRPNKSLPERITGELREDGMHLNTKPVPKDIYHLRDIPEVKDVLEDNPIKKIKGAPRQVIA